MDGDADLMREIVGDEGSSGGRDVDFDGDLGGARLPSKTILDPSFRFNVCNAAAADCMVDNWTH